VIADRNGLNSQLNVVIGNSIQDWGVECTKFEVQSFQPANREVEVSCLAPSPFGPYSYPKSQRQLEIQMEAERNRRKQLLDTQAQVNVAEGHKQRVILESEGHVRAILYLVSVTRSEPFHSSSKPSQTRLMLLSRRSYEKLRLG